MTTLNHTSMTTANNFNNKVITMTSQLIELANSSSMYERKALSYLESLTDVNYSVLMRMYSRSGKKVTLSSFTNSLLKGKLNKSKSII